MITSDDLKLICNYSETNNQSGSNIGQITYMDMVVTQSEEHRRRILEKKRDLTIDAFLEDKIEEFQNEKELNLDSDMMYDSVSPKIVNQSVTGQFYNTLDDIYKEVMLKLENLTKNSMKVNSKNFDIMTQNNQNITKDLAQNIYSLNLLIASQGRKGPANTIIVGAKAFEYFLTSNYFTSKSNSGIVKGKVFGANIILSHEIKPNKVIMIRVSQSPDVGLNLVNRICDKTFFLAETTNWENQIKWFDFI